MSLLRLSVELCYASRRVGVRGLFDGITGTWLRQMSYSMCRFWAYDESKKLLGAGAHFSELATDVADYMRIGSSRQQFPCLAVGIGWDHG